MKIINVPFESAVISDTHDSMYLMHKYWARKPANVVSEYIQYFTQENDLVFDPFGGSGVTSIEAAKLNRNSIYNDLSPTACFIAKETIRNVDLLSFKSDFDKLLNNLLPLVITLYETKCTKCNYEKALITHAYWKQDKFSSKDKLLFIKTKCSHCGSKVDRSPIEEDLILQNRIETLSLTYWVPEDQLIPNSRLMVGKDMKVVDLFTKRALIVLSSIYHILDIEHFENVETLKFLFTSSLAQSSKLVPFYSKKGREKEVGGWTLPGFWIPDQYCEVNAINCLNERYKKINKGKSLIKEDLLKKIDFHTCSATDLAYLDSESIDYIFTDPPYGDSVPYLEYQLIWSSWLRQKLDFENEVVISDAKSRNKNIDDYQSLMRKSFDECYRVLKPEQWMTVTFHNSQIKVWNALISSAIEAGFDYINDCYVLTGRLSSNQLLRKSSSMTGDIYINFRKPIRKKVIVSKELEEVKKEIFMESEKIISERGGYATTDQLARGILMNLSKNNLFNQVIDLKVTDILQEEFVYNKDLKVWKLRENEESKLLEYIPLETRIISVIDSVLASCGKNGCELDDFLVPIFTKFKNGRTPDTKDIIDILRNNAVEKKDKWYPNDQLALFSNYELSELSEMPIEYETKIQNEHNSIIFQLAKIGLGQNYSIWIGENEKRKSIDLKALSVNRLIIPGISDKAIRESRIDQIDLIWFDLDKGEFILFEIENSTRMINCIPRLANLTERLPNLRIPIYIVIPDKLFEKAGRLFSDPSNKKLILSEKYVIKYSKLFENLDLLENKKLDINNFLSAVAIQM